MKNILIIPVVIASAMLFAGCEPISGDFELDNEPLELPEATENTNIDDTTPVAGEGPMGLPAGTQWIYGKDISHWRETIHLSGATITFIKSHNNYHRVTVDGDPLRGFPAWYQNPDPRGYNDNNVNGTIWILRKYQGQWYMGSIDYLRVGQTSKNFAVLPQYQIEARSGEKVGVMVSTVAREWDGTRVDGDPRSPYRYRSNIVWTTWP